MHSRGEMANQNGRAHPSRNAHLPGFHRDEDRSEARDRDRSSAMRDDERAFDDRAFGDRYVPGRSWRPEDQGERGDRSFDRDFGRDFGRDFDRGADRSFGRDVDRGADRSFGRGFDDRPDDRPGDQDDRRWGRRHERFSESDRSREPFGARDREDRGQPGRGELRIDIQGSRSSGEGMPRQDQLLRGAYRDHDESSRDLSYRAGPPHAEPYGPTGERTQESRGGAGPARGRMSQGRGPHTGKGPVGFQRSDDRIRELVCEALTDDGEVDATHIEITVKGGEVTLTGSIEDRRMKRLAEDCVEAVPGVKDVHNQLRIGAADRGGHGTERTEKPAADKHDRHAEPSDKKHRPS